jgi:hypothetical protein
MLDRNLSKEEIDVFHTIPPILPLKTIRTGWNGAGITSSTDTISVVFSDCHKEVGLKCLQIMQVPTNLATWVNIHQKLADFVQQCIFFKT